MNQITRIKEFEQVLKNYQLSDQAKVLLSEIKLVLLCGPSASGRNTIIDQLIETGKYWFIVSDTTRKPRINNNVKEQNGGTYWFRSEEEFIDELNRGEFLEAEIIHKQQVSGISIRELRRAKDSGKIAIDEVDVGGFVNIQSVKPDMVGIFILPPSFEEWMLRFHKRGQMPDAEVISRLNTGVRIFTEALNNQQAFIVVNDKLDQAVADVDAVVKGALTSNDGKVVAKELLQATKAYLARA